MLKIIVETRIKQNKTKCAIIFIYKWIPSNIAVKTIVKLDHLTISRQKTNPLIQKKLSSWTKPLLGQKLSITKDKRCFPVKRDPTIKYC